MDIAKSGTGNGYAWEVLEWPEGTRPWRSDPVAFCPDYACMTPESQADFIKSMDAVAYRREEAKGAACKPSAE